MLAVELAITPAENLQCSTLGQVAVFPAQGISALRMRVLAGAPPEMADDPWTVAVRRSGTTRKSHPSPCCPLASMLCSAILSPLAPFFHCPLSGDFSSPQVPGHPLLALLCAWFRTAPCLWLSCWARYEEINRFAALPYSPFYGCDILARQLSARRARITTRRITAAQQGGILTSC